MTIGWASLGSGGDHPLVGRSVPNFEFEDGTTAGELLRGGQGTLLDFDGSEFLERLANEYGHRLRFFCGRPKIHLGLRAVLVRPDGFVAWACDNLPNETSLRQTAALWFGSCATNRTP